MLFIFHVKQGHSYFYSQYHSKKSCFRYKNVFFIRDRAPKRGTVPGNWGRNLVTLCKQGNKDLSAWPFVQCPLDTTGQIRKFTTLCSNWRRQVSWGLSCVSTPSTKKPHKTHTDKVNASPWRAHKLLDRRHATAPQTAWCGAHSRTSIYKWISTW